MRYRAAWQIDGLGGRRIAAGEVVELDPEDPDVAALLASSEVLEEVDDEPPPTHSNLEHHTKAELAELAAERGLELDPGQLTKAEMIAALEALD